VKEAKIQSNSAIFCEIIDPIIDPNEKWMQIFLKTPTGRVLAMMVQMRGGMASLIQSLREMTSKLFFNHHHLQLHLHHSCEVLSSTLF
jgi:hypothetical protein